MAYLVQRGNSFHFRIRVPTDLRPVLGKRERRRSLAACNGKREARRKAHHLYVATDKYFDRLRAGEMLDVEQALNAWVADRLHDYEVQRTLAGPLTEAQALEAQGAQVATVRNLEENLRLNRLSDYEDMTESVAKRYLGRDDIDKESTEFKLLCRSVARRLHHIEFTEYERLEGSYCEVDPSLDKSLASAFNINPEGDVERAPTDSESPEPAPQEPSDTPSPTLSQVAAEYVAQKVREGSWTEKTRMTNEAIFALAVRVLGDAPFSAIGFAEARQFKETALKLPPNINKNPHIHA